MSTVFWRLDQRGNARDCWRREKGEGTSLAFDPVSPLFASTLTTAHLEQPTATATNGFIFQVTDSLLQSMGIRLTWLECKRFLNWFSCEIMSS